METKQGEEIKDRYTRQIPLLGEEGQRKLSRSKILIAGAGGLGSAVATYLAYAGAGYIRIADNDIVEETNLNRQILYNSSDIGRSKTEAAEEKILAINPEITVDAVYGEINEDTAPSLFKGVDLVIDGMDNFGTRYTLNKAALKTGIPMIHGAVSGFYGQASTIIPGETPCLNCIIPNPPEDKKVPVIGMTCGVIGSIEVTEAVKYLTGTGLLLTNRLLLWDGMRCEAEYIPVQGSPECPYCKFIDD